MNNTHFIFRMHNLLSLECIIYFECIVYARPASFQYQNGGCVIEVYCETTITLAKLKIWYQMSSRDK